MTITITATYDNATALANVVDELVNDGIEREKIYRDEDKTQVKVIVPKSIEPAVLEILERHGPLAIT